MRNINRLIGDLENSFSDEKRVFLQSLQKGQSFYYTFRFLTPLEIQDFLEKLRSKIFQSEWKYNQSENPSNLEESQKNLNIQVSISYLGFTIYRKVVSTEVQELYDPFSKKILIENTSSLVSKLLYHSYCLAYTIIFPIAKIHIKIMGDIEPFMCRHDAERIIEQSFWVSNRHGSTTTRFINSSDFPTAERKWEELKNAYHINPSSMNVYDLPFDKSKRIFLNKYNLGNPLYNYMMGLGVLLMTPAIILGDISNVLFNKFRKEKKV